VLGHAAEGVACVPMLLQRLDDAGVDAPALRGLAGVIEGDVEAASWAESLTAPRPAPKRRQKVRAA
jgi:glycerol-3-phosphate dehydrogenase (NAD(P)+)